METAKDCLITIWKESLKFALLGIVSLFSIGLLSIWVLSELLKIDIEISAMIAGTITAIIIFIIDIKKIHSTNKIADANTKMTRIILKRLMG